MKKLTLLFVALLALVGNVNAKTFETTLWEDTYNDEVELNAETVATFKAGDVLRIYATVPESGANFKIVYKGAPDWSETTIPSIDNQWPWVYYDKGYYDLTFTDADITAFSEKNIYIYKGDYSTITKVMLMGEVPTTGETELQDAAKTFTEEWEWDEFAARTDAKVGDVIRLTYTAYKDDSEDWPYVQFNIKDSNNDDIVTFADNKAKNSENTYDFEITNATVLEKIQTGGFKITGARFILTSVKLLTYADSYDAVSVTIGSDGIATWSHSKNLDFTGTGITAYYASAVTKGAVTLTKTATTWNYQGFILRGAEGTYTVKVVADTEATWLSTNYLKGQTSEGTVAASTSGTYHYIFAKDKQSGNIGFYKLTSAHTLGANKAYLETTDDIAATAAHVALVFDDEETTSIRDVRRQATDTDTCYTISGQRVEQPTKGLYIVNGKKVIIK